MSMNAQLPMFEPTTSVDTANATSSPASASGVTRSSKQDGQTTIRFHCGCGETSVLPSLETPCPKCGKIQSGEVTYLSSGQAPAPVSPSPQQDVKVASVMSAISGRTGRGSLASANLALSLANKLRQRTDLLGSTLFALT